MVHSIATNKVLETYNHYICYGGNAII